MVDLQTVLLLPLAAVSATGREADPPCAAFRGRRGMFTPAPGEPCAGNQSLSGRVAGDDLALVDQAVNVIGVNPKAFAQPSLSPPRGRVGSIVGSVVARPVPSSCVAHIRVCNCNCHN